MRGMGGGPGPTEPPPSAAEEVVEENSGGEEEELELGLCLGSKKQQQQQSPAPAPCRILTARNLQPAAALSPDSSVSSSSPAAASRRAKPEEGSNPGASPGTVASGHPQSFGVVGWPPIRTFRMNSLFGQAKDNAPDADTKKTAADESELQKDKEESEKKGRTPGWVKVNMDGEVIGRKVDLNAHRSYKTLALALEIMFSKPSAGLCAPSSTKSPRLLDNSSEYQLTYEDRDGDWMLVGDVPWEMFVGSVKRLRIMRTSDASGLGPRVQAIHRIVTPTRGRT
ncbi:auxin-responsive protein IAA10-like [Lolium rigidum]|uniref:auxin-responsive protein IAA10-like n=1 Tax=Lolium rigidum TaxID=89674 RepID=UPI001F5DB0C7|nr:auxin-responsive protein IAA10-like [Lolium rigidum]